MGLSNFRRIDCGAKVACSKIVEDVDVVLISINFKVNPCPLINSLTASWLAPSHVASCCATTRVSRERERSRNAVEVKRRGFGSSHSL